MRKGKGQGGEEKWKLGVNHGMGRSKVMEARRLGEKSATLPCVLLEEFNVHPTLIARDELVLMRPTAKRTFRLL